ncbi:uncharacterized protein LOC144599552 [Rhinoraja longicauda]
MLSLRRTLLHLFLLMVPTGWADGATMETEGAAESSELSPWATAVRAPTSMLGAVMGRSVWLPPLDHPAAPRAAERRRKRKVTFRDHSFNRRAAKPRTFKPKPRKTPEDRRRRISFPMDRIGRSYLSKTKR